MSDDFDPNQTIIKRLERLLRPGGGRRQSDYFAARLKAVGFLVVCCGITYVMVITLKLPECGLLSVP